MKQLSLIFSLIALILAGITFFKQRSGNSALPEVKENKNVANAADFRIAYFEMDSIEANYRYVKDAYALVKTKEEAINNELAGIEKSYQKKISEWQQKGAQMTQAESQQVQKEYGQMQQNYQNKKNTLEQELTEMRNKKLRDIQLKIEDYLKEYNKEKRYSYIFSYEPALFIYYKDPAYNITGELLTGLNKAYSETKEK